MAARLPGRRGLKRAGSGLAWGLAIAFALAGAGVARGDAEPEAESEQRADARRFFEHGGRLLASAGASQLEGSAGGGLVPWAVIAGYGTEDEVGGAAFYSRVDLQDYELEAYGLALGLWNRLELSVARQKLEVEPLDQALRQMVLGAKVRLLGDLVYTAWPTVALGAQYKRSLDFDLPEALGARDRDGVDVYLAASKLFLEGVLGRPLLLSGSVRATRANQLGLLGFGGDRHSRYGPQLEGSAALLLTRRLAAGYEFRQKPDNLRVAHEGPWQDVFVAGFLSKHATLVAGYAWLDDVVLWGDQAGWYLSIQASF